MTIEDLLRDNRGYQIRSIRRTNLDPEGIAAGFLRRLRTIPNKITTQLRRDRIAAVYKTRFGSLDDTYYIIVATDGTRFHVDF